MSTWRLSSGPNNNNNENQNYETVVHFSSTGKWQTYCNAMADPRAYTYTHTIMSPVLLHWCFGFIVLNLLLDLLYILVVLWSKHCHRTHCQDLTGKIPTQDNATNDKQMNIYASYMAFWQNGTIYKVHIYILTYTSQRYICIYKYVCTRIFHQKYLKLWRAFEWNGSCSEMNKFKKNIYSHIFSSI